MTRGWHVPVDGGEKFSAPFVGFEAAFLADGSESDGDLLVYRGVGAPGVDHALHAHDDSTEAFFVQSGHAAIYVDGKWFNAAAGDFVGVPRGAAHGWRVVGDEPVRIVIIHAPASGYAAAWREFDRLAREGTATPERLATTAEQHVRVRFLGRLPDFHTEAPGR